MSTQVTEPVSAAEEARRLVARFQAGDADAYGEIYRRYRDPVFFFVRRKVGDHQLAEDLMHDTFVRALRSVGRWEWQGKDVGAWLITIARNLVVDHFKCARTRYEFMPGELLGDDQADRSREGRPESAVIEHLRDVALLTALRGLTEDQRACIVHRFVQGLSVAETAAVMDRDEGAVKSLQMRAVAALALRFDGRPWL